MTYSRAQAIRHWIKNMGFKLSKSHVLDHRSRKVKYYTLGSFGIYEDIQIPGDSKKTVTQKFISWTPWGIDFEINSVRDLSKAYADFLKYNPSVELG
jgi:hypothetical protein